MKRVGPLDVILQFTDPAQVPNVIVVAAVSASGPPGKPLVTLPLTVPVQKFDVLPFSNVTEPVRFPVGFENSVTPQEHTRG